MKAKIAFKIEIGLNEEELRLLNKLFDKIGGSTLTYAALLEAALRHGLCYGVNHPKVIQSIMDAGGK